MEGVEAHFWRRQAEMPLRHPQGSSGRGQRSLELRSVGVQKLGASVYRQYLDVAGSLWGDLVGQA